ncbi:MAG TPA: hypothetical protein VGQ97_03815 [Xanthobacteraceae bacterium]|nr:hypothetical protein [Xanthobacteraceae bacterium]
MLAFAGGPAAAQPLYPGSPTLLPPVAEQSQWLPFSLFGSRACKRQPVFQINAVTLAEAKGKIEVQVEAVANTALWTDAALVARQGSRPPRTLEFDFVACPPGGYVMQVLAPIAGRQLIDAAPRDIDTIIVHSRTNSMAARVKDLLR